MKHSTPDLIKFKRLQRRLGLPRYAVVGILESLWIATQKNAPRGNIGVYDDEAIAIEMDWQGDPTQLIDMLVETGWLDRCDTHRLVVHDWQAHAPRYVHGVVAKSGEGFATVESDCSRQLQSATIDGNCTRQQPNLTKPNLTKPNQFMSTSVDGVSVQEFFDRWNRFAAKTPKIAGARALTKKRADKLRARLKDPGWFEDFREASKSLPLPGEGWQPTLDWVIRNDHNIYLILEGAYDWRGKDDPASQKLAMQKRRRAVDERQREESQRKERATESAKHAVQSALGEIVATEAG